MARLERGTCIARRFDRILHSKLSGRLIKRTSQYWRNRTAVLVNELVKRGCLRPRLGKIFDVLF